MLTNLVNRTDKNVFKRLSKALRLTKAPFMV